MDEEEAIARVKQGDLNGLEELVERYQVKAAHAAFLIVQDAALAEDVTQNAFLKAYQKIDQFDSRRSFEPWFMRSVVNAAIKAANRQKRFISLSVVEENANVELIERLADPQPGPDEMVERSEMHHTASPLLPHPCPSPGGRGDKASPMQMTAGVMGGRVRRKRTPCAVQAA